MGLLKSIAKAFRKKLPEKEPELTKQTIEAVRKKVDTDTQPILNPGPFHTGGIVQGTITADKLLNTPPPRPTINSQEIRLNDVITVCPYREHHVIKDFFVPDQETYEPGRSLNIGGNGNITLWVKAFFTSPRRKKFALVEIVSCEDLRHVKCKFVVSVPLLYEWLDYGRVRNMNNYNMNIKIMNYRTPIIIKSIVADNTS